MRLINTTENHIADYNGIQGKSVHNSKFQNVPDGREAVSPSYLLSFRIIPTAIRDRDFIDSESLLCDFSG